MNSKEQFSQLVMKHKDSLFFTAKSILRNDADAEDAVCSAIMKAFESFGQLREQEYFKSWITRIVINEAYMICRKNRNLQSVEEMATEPSYNDYHDEMWEIVNSLDEEFRTVIIMFYYNDIPVKEIAEYLNIAPGTVKSRLNRGRQKLREMITI
ncbi:MAG: sigma-70 family RNA polymerase sigma factor [Oscillospiraceae bacterium]|nr:sigma-70 family RNA polymerase sigma factor [Oscillospiraceae bacterium]